MRGGKSAEQGWAAQRKVGSGSAGASGKRRRRRLRGGGKAELRLRGGSMQGLVRRSARGRPRRAGGPNWRKERPIQVRLPGQSASGRPIAASAVWEQPTCLAGRRPGPGGPPRRCPFSLGCLGARRSWLSLPNWTNGLWQRAPMVASLAATALGATWVQLYRGGALSERHAHFSIATVPQSGPKTRDRPKARPSRLRLSARLVPALCAPRGGLAVTQQVWTCLTTRAVLLSVLDCCRPLPPPPPPPPAAPAC